MLRTIAAASALLTGVALFATTSPAESAPYAAGTSSAHEDSVYPAKGSPGVDALRYNLDLTWSSLSRRLEGTATIALRATKSASRFSLDLGAGMKVQQVTVNGSRVSNTHKGKRLTVATPVVTGARYTVKVVYAGSPRTTKAPSDRPDLDGLGWHTSYDGQTWTVQQPYGAYTWFPVNDQPSDKALYDVRLNVPSPWVGVSNGRLTKRSSANGRTVTRFTNRDPLPPHLLTVAIGAYKQYKQTGPHGIPITQWVPRGHSGMLAPLRKTPAALRFLEAKLGPYPFDRVGIIVTPGEAAVGTATMLSLGRGNYRYGNRDVRETVVRGLVQSWYGGTVTPNDWRDVWMTEGMATYLQTRFSAAKKWTTWGAWQRQWARDDDFWRELYGPPGNYTRKYFGAPNVTQGGALIFNRLRARLGAKAFDRLLWAWPRQHPNSSQNRSSYESWLEAKTGQNLGPFFKTWLMSKNSPASGSAR